MPDHLLPPTQEQASTSTLVDQRSSPYTAPSINVSSATLDVSDLDSIWNVGFNENWEQRQKEEAEALSQLRASAPTLVQGFAVSQGQTNMSRRTSRQGGSYRSAVGSGRTSKAASKLELGTEPNLEQLDRLPTRGAIWSRIDDNRRWLRRVMRLKRYHLTMIGLVGFDLMIVMVELIVALLTAGCTSDTIYHHLLTTIEHAPKEEHLTLSSFACSLTPSLGREQLEDGIFGVNISLLSTFALDVFFAIYAFGPYTFCKSWVTVLDAFVIATTLCLDIYFHLSDNPASKSPIALVILRLWKVFRAVHGIAHALELHYQEVIDTAETGRKQLEWERIAESHRLQYVRQALIKGTGEDIDPFLVEAEVQKQREILEKKQAEETMQQAHAAHQGRISNLVKRTKSNRNDDQV